MYLFKKSSYLSAFILSFLMAFSVSLNASSDDFTDEQIKGFASAVTQIMNIQQQSQMQMIQVIEEYEMDVQRFNLLYMQMQQMPIDEIDGTDKEKEDMAEIVVEIEKIQHEIESVVIGTIEDEGLTIEVYEAIMTAYQQDPELQQRIQQEME